MLAEKPFIKIPKAQLMTVAGQYNGKQIICKSPEIFTVFKQLEPLARAGNHWARISIHGINELTAGRFHQNNVFVRKDNPLANGRGQFFMILPGIRATFEDTADGKYVLVGLQLDSNYQELQKVGQKPGLFNVTQDNRGLSIKPTTSIKATRFAVLLYQTQHQKK